MQSASYPVSPVNQLFSNSSHYSQLLVSPVIYVVILVIPVSQSGGLGPPLVLWL